jgi:predicted transcriptional regulator YdeE
MINGISVTTNNKNELSEESERIAPLWEKYDLDNVYSQTFNKAHETSFYGVYSNYVTDFNGDFDVTVGVEVTKDKNALIIENTKYLLFTKQGELPEVAYELWQEIWDYFANNSEYKRAYTVDFEKYSKENEVEIYVSIV